MKKSVLVAIDGSYMQYHSIFRAIRLWSSKNKLEARGYLIPREDGTQSNLINSETFKTALYNAFLHTCYVIPEIVEGNFRQYSGFDMKGYATVVFCADDWTSRGFRKQIYDDYKGGRLEARAKSPYDLRKIKQYFNVIFDQTDVWNRCGFKHVFVEGAEADDIIYKLMTTYGRDYDRRIVIASDKDLLQIPDTLQFDLNDKLIKREGNNGPLSVQEFLIRKILIGDASDNIPKVFDRVGPAKAEKLIKEGKLKEKLSENKKALEQFKLNMQLMDISKMPEDLSRRIESKLAEIMKDEGNVFLTLDDTLESMSGMQQMIL